MSKIYATKDTTITQRELDHVALSRWAAGECIVLIENDGALPLARPAGSPSMAAARARPSGAAPAPAT